VNVVPNGSVGTQVPCGDCILDIIKVCGNHSDEKGVVPHRKFRSEKRIGPLEEARRPAHPLIGAAVNEMSSQGGLNFSWQCDLDVFLPHPPD
jgi:hypothetical protein